MAKRDNSDFMSRRQDEQTEQLEERLTALYANAENEIRSKWADFSAGFEKDDKLKRDLVESGSLPEEEYIAWRKTQVLKSTQYSKAVESMTNVLVKTDEAAMATVNDQLPQVVAESYDYVQALGFKAADEAGLTTGTFQIYNARTVQALIKENPDLMPAPKVNIPEDQRWNKERINREITQGIVQGESIPKIAHRLQQVTTMDRNAAVRNARTAMTGAENLGRYESAQDLRENGIPVEEVWMATPDDRTRESHRLLDGTTRDESGYFGVGIIDTPLRFAGDPLGAPEEVYNCRCRTGIVLQGIDHSQDQDLYEEFMKQFEDGKEMIEGTEIEYKQFEDKPKQESMTVGRVDFGDIHKEGHEVYYSSEYKGSGEAVNSFFEKNSNYKELIDQMSDQEKKDFKNIWSRGKMMHGEQYGEFSDMTPRYQQATRNFDRILDQATINESIEVARMSDAQLLFGAGTKTGTLDDFTAMKGQQITCGANMSFSAASEGLAINWKEPPTVEYHLKIPEGSTGSGMYIGDKEINIWGDRQREFMTNRNIWMTVGDTEYDEERKLYKVEILYGGQLPHEY